MDIKRFFVVGTAGFVLICMGLYHLSNNSARSPGNSEINIYDVQAKMAELKTAVADHGESMKEIDQLAFSNNDEVPQVFYSADDSIEDFHIQQEKKQKVCSASFGIEERAKGELDMLDIYETLKFDNVDGGAWKQGWDIQVDNSRFTEKNKLKVFVVPHSHNDPGWLKTFEHYFEAQTKDILDHMLENLSRDESVKFIWAEISYFSLWWNGISEANKTSVKRILEKQQLEFVTGGWVMPDESSSHYYSILTQLIEGHQWLFQHLGYIPKNGWSIDPFGLSPTMAYLLGRAGLNNMLIQRTHYSVKKHLAQLQELEFKWRQSWDSDGGTDILCHMMPFYFYDIPHTCGPDPKICCQFDFKRLSGVSSLTCPWNKAPQPIVAQNVKSRSMLLLDQYRKKSMLYKTNVLLVPLGDDFRWTDQPEWTAQVTNYQKIFDYINSQAELNAEVKFGTLDDYFNALSLEINEDRFSPSVLTGDFFTYADRDDHYWSGYFTSRPFHKAMDRELMSHLRSAQILFTLMCAEISRNFSNGLESQFIRDLLGNLIVSRRHLSLFQHHDGVAGTAKDHVMVDYANKLYDGLKKTNHVMQQSLHVLSHLKDPSFDLTKISNDSQFYESVYTRETSNTLPQYTLVVIDTNNPNRIITVFNPVAHVRTQLVNLYVSTCHVSVFDMEDNKVDFEILPVFENKTIMSNNMFQLSILVELEPLAVKHLNIQLSETMADVHLTEIYVKNAESSIVDSNNFVIQSMEEIARVNISNGYVNINFHPSGFAKSVEVNQKTYPFSIGMFKYGAQKPPHNSGLYIFMPDGNATNINTANSFIRIVKGKFQSYVEVWLDQVKHRITLYNHPGLEKYSIEVTNTVDIRQERDFELMMRLQTSIKSGEFSYTDLNGFQMIRRKRFAKLPIQANYFPLPSATYIEDSDLRMSVLSKQPLGTASLSSGEIEIMLDRRHSQDDSYGVGQGCLDNLETLNTFKVIFETPDCLDGNSADKPPMLSLAAQMTLHSLLNPLRAFAGFGTPSPLEFMDIKDYSIATNPDGLSCDIQLVDLPMLPSYKNSLDDESYMPAPHAGLLLHRVGFDGRFLNGVPLPECSIDETKLGHFQLHDMTGDLFQPELQQTTLSFIHEGNILYTNESTVLKSMEVYGFRIKFQSSVISSNVIPINDIVSVDER